MCKRIKNAAAPTKYIIKAAIHEETMEPWVWLGDNSEGAKNRWIIIKNGKKKVKVYLRRIDSNFIGKYNESQKYTIKEEGRDTRTLLIENDSPQRIPIENEEINKTLVISEFYRKKLGIEKTTHNSNTEPDGCELSITDISRRRIFWFRFFPALHPKPNHRYSP